MPASGTVGSGTFITDGTGIAAGNPLNTGILDSIYSAQGFSILLDPTFPNSTGPLSLLGANTIDGATYTFNGTGTNLQIRMAVSIPITIDLDGVLLNGTASGQVVANAAVPEPSTLMLGGVGMILLVALARRWRKAPS